VRQTRREGKTKKGNGREKEGIFLFRTIAGTVDGNSPAKEKRTPCAGAEKKEPNVPPSSTRL
jgi:hypothetical protein